MHSGGLRVIVCDVHLVTQDAVEFHCVFAEDVYLHIVMVLVSDFYTVLRVFFVTQNSPSFTILLWDLLNDIAETFEEVVASATRIKQII